MNDGLQVTALSVRYGNAVAVRNCTLSVAPGQVMGMVGRNGVGKTSSLRAISALIPHSGEVTLGGRPLPRRPDAVAAAGVAHVPEGRGLFGNMTVAANLRYACAAIGADPGAIEMLLKDSAFAALSGLSGRPAGYLSGGEQQLLALARGLVVAPKVLMVDELSLGLSPKALWDVTSAVIGIARQRGIALLLVDQNARVLREVADSMIIMRDGVTVAIDRNDESELTSLYLS